ncbi:hypothetical protein QF037_008922 [Streptomyces canus]|uniref:hypothetical protein n=1 Tax=Streptomyces canus TaxID=58343 RepID=UPI00278A8E23|nr:hypothetical protein [Streptomyces canus]MDQ0604577.1 hypothetical protein [Streptomyces canus]
MDIGNAELLRRDLRSLCRTLFSPSSPDGVAAVVVAGEQGIAVRVEVSRRWPRAVSRIVGLTGVLAVHGSVEQALTVGGPSSEGRGRPELGKSS